MTDIKIQAIQKFDSPNNGLIAFMIYKNCSPSCFIIVISTGVYYTLRNAEFNWNTCRGAFLNGSKFEVLHF